MKQQLEKIIDQLSSKELTFGCRIRIGKDVYTYGDAYEMCEVAHWDECYLTTFDSGCGCCSSPESVRIKVGPGGDSLGDFTILGHPVRIGDVLERLCPSDRKVGDYINANRLLIAWQPLGITKSLQEIFGPECEWEHDDGPIGVGVAAILDYEPETWPKNPPRKHWLNYSLNYFYEKPH